MKKNNTVYTKKSKLDNALYYLTKYVTFLEHSFFTIAIFCIMIGFFMAFIGIVNNDYVFLRDGFLMVLITVAVYLLLVKPLFLIMYALAKILINTEKEKTN